MFVDGSSLIFRAFYGVPASMRSPDGRPVNAVRGFMDRLATLVDEWRPARLAVASDDDWRPAWRVDLIPSYKAHRVAEPVPPELDGEWADAQLELEKFLHAPTEIAHEGILERGELWNVLNDVIHRHSIDLIVLGSHGRRGLKKLVLGSGAEQIFRNARCPVLAVGPNVPQPSSEVIEFKHIIFATDFSDGSLKALPYALSLAEENQASLTLLHVLPLVPMQHQIYLSGGTEKRLEALVPSDAKDWCQVSAVVSFEFPAEGILDLAKIQSADLIVMGVHKHAPRVAAHLPWAIAYEVVCHAPCPVLTVRG